MNRQDIDELTEVFVEESQEIVDNLNRDVLELEQYVDSSNLNRELINNIFRYVHTLKGNSGLAGADKLRDLAHKLESLLDRLRKDKITLSAEMVDILFEGIDRFKSILQEIISGTNQGVNINDLIQRLETILGGGGEEPPKLVIPENDWKMESSKHPPRPPLAAPPLELDGHGEGGQSGIPDDIARILTEYEETRLLENLRTNRKIYELVLNLTMDGFDRIVTAVIENIAPTGEVIAKVPSSKTLPNYDLQVRMIFASSASVQTLTTSLAALPELAPQDFSIKFLLGAGKEIISPGKPVVPPRSSEQIAGKKEAVKKDVVSKEPIRKVSPPAGQKKPEPPTLVQKKPEPLTLVQKKTGSPTSVQKKPGSEEFAESASGKTVSIKETAELTGNTVRVDIKKLDNLMNIVGELVLAKARYVQFESELDGIAAYKMLRENFKRNNKLTSKKLEDLREAILQVRMVPVGNLFSKFPRVVRDLAKKHNKQLQLTLEGKETELDKAVIDEMGDPLMHLIRNAIDHGIEEQKTRLEKGKPEVGTITLRAYQEGSYIVIEMEDDGAGMDVDRIREKAIESGLTEREVKLSESEILSFIFQPGFSTARVVTDTSGRGVGMDVVKSTVSRLKGIIDIKTVLSVGTKFIIKLPLTLAIIQVLLIKINNCTYAIPLSSVTESFKLDMEKIEFVDAQEVTQLRNTVLPLLRVNEIFRIQTMTPEIVSTPQANLAERADVQSEKRKFVVVIGLAGKKIGLVVDDLVGQQEIVIKPLGRYLLNTPGFAGATTLGDGRVVLILDVVGLIENLNKKKIRLKNQQEKKNISV